MSSRITVFNDATVSGCVYTCASFVQKWIWLPLFLLLEEYIFFQRPYKYTFFVAGNSFLLEFPQSHWFNSWFSYAVPKPRVCDLKISLTSPQFKPVVSNSQNLTQKLTFLMILFFCRTFIFTALFWAPNKQISNLIKQIII